MLTYAHSLILMAQTEEEVAAKAAETMKTAMHAVETAAQTGHTTALVTALTIFVLSIFVGFLVITKVPQQLHTPLMSGSNAISGITVVGALFAAGVAHGAMSTFMGFLAVILATINVVGGFYVTHIMLKKFKPKKRS